MRELDAFEKMEDVERLLAALKHILRQKGIRQARIAEELQVSEATVRRYLSGKGMSLQVLGQLCQIADNLRSALPRATVSSCQNATSEMEALANDRAQQTNGPRIGVHLNRGPYRDAELIGDMTDVGTKKGRDAEWPKILIEYLRHREPCIIGNVAGAACALPKNDPCQLAEST